MARSHMRCPDHPRDLHPDEAGHTACPFCKGKLLSEAELVELCADALSRLSVEARQDAVIFKKPQRNCPSCDAKMTPMRVGEVEQWIERCSSCALYWCEKNDLATLKMFSRSQARQKAYATFTPEEKKELARDLAAATAGPQRDELSYLQIFLGYLGVPIVSRSAANRIPIMTWTLAALLIALFLGTKLDPDTFGTKELGYLSGTGISFSLLTATFAHAGWLHLIGNVAFLLAFGDGVEQKWPSWVVGLVFAIGGALTLFLDGVVGPPGTLIVGASGGVEILVGACIVLEPKAKVIYFLFGKLPLKIPMIAYGIFELGYQAAMAALGVSGVAWVAHLSGLIIGIALGFMTRAKWLPQPAVA